MAAVSSDDTQVAGFGEKGMEFRDDFFGFSLLG